MFYDACLFHERYKGMNRRCLSADFASYINPRIPPERWLAVKVLYNRLVLTLSESCACNDASNNSPMQRHLLWRFGGSYTGPDLFCACYEPLPCTSPIQTSYCIINH